MNPPRSQKEKHTVTAFIWVTLAMFFLALIAGLVRYCTERGIDPFQILFLRTVFSVIWMSPLLYTRGLEIVQTEQIRLFATRVVLSFASMAAMFHAFDLIPIGEVTAIGFLSPIFGTMFAIVLLGEVVHTRRWLALGVGLIGAMIMLRPGLSEFGAGQALALVSAMAIGLIGPLVKQLTARDDPDRIVFITNLCILPLALIPALWVWVWPPIDVWIALIALGLVGIAGHAALVRGYHLTDASLVMTFKFSRLPFAVLIGYLAFDEVIDGPVWIGAAIIFLAAVYITRRETQLKAAERKPSATEPVHPIG